MKTPLFITLFVCLLFFSCEKTPRNPQEESLGKITESTTPPIVSDFTVPEELLPVGKYKNGYSLDETQNYRDKYNSTSIVTADDVGSYASTHLSEFNRSAVVHRNGDVSKLKSNRNPDVGNVVATSILGTMTLEEVMRDSRSRMKAIAVIHKGELVYEEYLGLRDWDNHLWASATKIFIGTLMHMVEEDGLVDFESPITDYVPELKKTDWEGIKLGDIVHMRSGLDISESRLNSSPDHPVTLFYANLGGSPGSLLDAVIASQEYVEPGSRYEYGSINTHVSTLVLQNVLNKPIEDIITERIWSKAGMEGDGILALSDNGEPMAAGAFAARLRDLARFGMLFTPSWRTISNEQVISDSYFNKAKMAAVPEIYGEDYMSKRLHHDFGVTGFGASYQWDAVFPDGDLYKSGRTGQCLYVSPETDTVVVWYSSSYKAEVWVHAYAREIVKQLYR